MNSAKSNITTMVDRLEANGLLRREGRESDRRAVEIFLTDKGREVYAAALEHVDEVDREIARFFGQKRAECVQQGIGELLEDLGMGG